jgi:hypothetical protein
MGIVASFLEGALGSGGLVSNVTSHLSFYGIGQEKGEALDLRNLDELLYGLGCEAVAVLLEDVRVN